MLASSSQLTRRAWLTGWAGLIAPALMLEGYRTADRSLPGPQFGPTALVPPKADIRLRDSGQFDKELDVSLRAGLPLIVAASGNPALATDYTPANLPERVELWLGAVEVAGGDVATVREGLKGTEKSFFVLMTWAPGTLGPWLWQEIRRRQTYRAAAGYDAVVVVDGRNRVKRIEFVRRR